MDSDRKLYFLDSQIPFDFLDFFFQRKRNNSGRNPFRKVLRNTYPDLVGISLIDARVSSVRESRSGGFTKIARTCKILRRILIGFTQGFNYSARKSIHTILGDDGALFTSNPSHCEADRKVLSGNRVKRSSITWNMNVSACVHEIVSFSAMLLSSLRRGNSWAKLESRYKF